MKLAPVLWLVLGVLAWRYLRDEGTVDVTIGTPVITSRNGIAERTFGTPDLRRPGAGLTSPTVGATGTAAAFARQVLPRDSDPRKRSSTT